MEEIDLMDFLNYYIEKLAYIILAISIAVLVGCLYTKFLQVPMYSSSTTIALVQQHDNENSDTAINQTELTLNQNLVSTYGEIIKSRRVLGQVVKNLKLDYTIKKLANKVSVSAIDNTSIIKITVVDENNELARDIANEIALVFNKEIVDIYNIKNISVIDRALKENTPYNINFVKQILICALVGLLVSSIFIFIIFYFDDGIKTKKEIEDKLGLPVLAEIPYSSKLSTKEMKNNIIETGKWGEV